jgi:hypothetical protein
MNQSRDRLFSLGSGCRIDCRIVRPSETQLLGSAASAWSASAINAAFHRTGAKRTAGSRTGSNRANTKQMSFERLGPGSGAATSSRKIDYR